MRIRQAIKILMNPHWNPRGVDRNHKAWKRWAKHSMLGPKKKSLKWRYYD